MRIYIKGDNVHFDDGKGNTLIMTTVELIELIRLFNLCITPEGEFHFNNLEFCV